jgi:hypothetical protein
MATLRTIRTTGEHLVEDIARLYCPTCGGLGYYTAYAFDLDSKHYIPDRDVECIDCNGTGI